MKKYLTVIILLICLLILCACKNNDVEINSGNSIFDDEKSENQILENMEIFERKIPNELKISMMKPCNEQFIYICTQDKSNYIYDYIEDKYKLILSDENIENIQFLNVLKNKNKIYLGIQYKDEKFSILDINYIDGTYTETELNIRGTDIKVSEDEKKITYRKDSSSLYISNLDGSNEKLLLKSIQKGEHPDTTGYVPVGFIENNKILYTCIGYEQTKGVRNYKF